VECPQSAADIEVLEIMFFFAGIQQNGCDQEAGQHKENVDADPPNDRQVADKIEDRVMGKFIGTIKDMQGHDKNDGNPAQTVHFLDMIDHKKPILPTRRFNHRLNKNQEQLTSCS
jgi:hypothetical protein